MAAGVVAAFPTRFHAMIMFILSKLLLGSISNAHIIVNKKNCLYQMSLW